MRVATRVFILKKIKMVLIPEKPLKNDLKNNRLVPFEKGFGLRKIEIWIRKPGYEWGRVLRHPIRPIKIGLY